MPWSRLFFHYFNPLRRLWNTCSMCLESWSSFMDPLRRLYLFYFNSPVPFSLEFFFIFTDFQRKSHVLNVWGCALLDCNEKSTKWSHSTGKTSVLYSLLFKKVHFNNVLLNQTKWDFQRNYHDIKQKAAKGTSPLISPKKKKKVSMKQGMELIQQTTF